MEQQLRQPPDWRVLETPDGYGSKPRKPRVQCVGEVSGRNLAIPTRTAKSSFFQRENGGANSVENFYRVMLRKFPYCRWVEQSETHKNHVTVVMSFTCSTHSAGTGLFLQ